jgi:ADP-ribose pyrophosphatase YjhB (NUDIX family)
MSQLNKQINQSVGALFLSKKTSRYLFVLRSGAKYDSTWAFVGGKVEKGETEFTALQREIVEEIGFMPLVLKTIPVEKFTNSKNSFTYTTYVCIIEEEFVPKLNEEHKGYAWSKLDSWPKPLHPGVFTTFQVDEIISKIKTIEDTMCNL